MRQILSEYSVAVFSVIAVVVGVGLIVGFFKDSNSDGFYSVYKADNIYDNDILYTENVYAGDVSEYDRIDMVTNIMDTVDISRFSESGTRDDYIINFPESFSYIKRTTTKVDGTVEEKWYKADGVTEVSAPDLSSVNKYHYTYNEAVALFSANNTIKLDGKSLTDPSVINRLEIVITKYVPVKSGVNAGVLTESVPAVDKYGNVITNSDGSIKKVDKIKYSEFTYNRDNINEFFIDWDTACRYRVLYRYTNDNNLKSEFSAMFANNIRTANLIFEDVYEEWVNP